MTMPIARKFSAAFACALLLLAACDSGSETMPAMSEPATSDDRIKSQLEAAIAATGDLPAGFIVEVEQGVVSITGELACEACGGLRTPANTGTIQQSLGAIARAVPGVSRVQFDLSYDID